MTLNCETKKFRDIIWDNICDAEESYGVNMDIESYDHLVLALRDHVICQLRGSGVEWSRVQPATDADMEAFDSAVRVAMPAIVARIKDFVRLVAHEESQILGKTIQIDRSGQGHCWRTVSASDISADTVEEIAAEMLDGGSETCDDFVDSSGQHYRW
jgi:hypothetical protein